MNTTENWGGTLNYYFISSEEIQISHIWFDCCLVLFNATFNNVSFISWRFTFMDCKDQVFCFAMIYNIYDAHISTIIIF